MHDLRSRRNELTKNCVAALGDLHCRRLAHMCWQSDLNRRHSNPWHIYLFDISVSHVHSGEEAHNEPPPFVSLIDTPCPETSIDGESIQNSIDLR